MRPFSLLGNLSGGCLPCCSDRVAGTHSYCQVEKIYIALPWRNSIENVESQGILFLLLSWKKEVRHAFEMQYINRCVKNRQYTCEVDFVLSACFVSFLPLFLSLARKLKYLGAGLYIYVFLSLLRGFHWISCIETYKKQGTQRIDFLRFFSSLLSFLYKYKWNFKFLGFPDGGLEAYHSLTGKATATDVVPQDCSYRGWVFPLPPGWQYEPTVSSQITSLLKSLAELLCGENKVQWWVKACIKLCPVRALSR